MGAMKRSLEAVCDLMGWDFPDLDGDLEEWIVDDNVHGSCEVMASSIQEAYSVGFAVLTGGPIFDVDPVVARETLESMVVYVKGSEVDKVAAAVHRSIIKEIKYQLEVSLSVRTPTWGRYPGALDTLYDRVTDHPRNVTVDALIAEAIEEKKSEVCHEPK